MDGASEIFDAHDIDEDADDARPQIGREGAISGPDGLRHDLLRAGGFRCEGGRGVMAVPCQQDGGGLCLFSPQGSASVAKQMRGWYVL